MQAPELLPPKKSLTYLELPRTAIDLVRMLAAVAEKSDSHIGRRQPVMVVPGFGGSDSYTFWLRRYLSQCGFAVEGWGMGFNSGGKGLEGEVDFMELPKGGNKSREIEVPLLSMKLRERVQQRVAEVGAPFLLVGHSLGGYLAREVARQAPDCVKALVTIGSPVYGGPKYTAVAPVFRKAGVDVDWIDEQIAIREKTPIPVPITTIVSPSDGVVGYQAAIDRNQPQAKLIEVDSGHCGMVFNPVVWRYVKSALQDASG